MHQNQQYRKDNTWLINVWTDTLNSFSKYKMELPQSTKVDINNIDISEQMKGKNGNECLVEVVNEDSFNLAITYLDQGYHPMVLNMASDFKPGGGVRSGKTAQEEELFRRSNAHLTHYERWYPMNSNTAIFSPEVTIIKDSRDNGYKTIKERVVSMYAIAGIRNPRLFRGEYLENDRKLMEMKIESIFKTAIKMNLDCLVLGAIGCGAFHNPPEQVAKIFKNMIDRYSKYFKKIGFAVLVGRDQENLKVFEKIILNK